jgi:hypothetical protein
MATNQTTVTLSTEAVIAFSGPDLVAISYAPLTMVGGVDQQEQLLLFRNEIDTVSGLTLTPREYRDMGQLSSDWLTLDEINRNITAITIPPGTSFTRDDGSVISLPALQAGESITVKRVNISAEPYVTWTTGSRITADQLNLQTAHLLGLLQEVKKTADNAIIRTDFDAVVNPLVEDLNADGFVVTGLSQPVDDTDAATKLYVDDAIVDNVSSQLGVANGIATLNSAGKLTASQAPGPLGLLPSAFFSQPTAPARGSGLDGLFGWGSLWFNLTNGRLYVYIPDDKFGAATEATDAEVGYWVDVSAPAQ